ncbi:MAG: radical SAM protein [Deltaproteobacteria bacterium]
MKILPGWDKKKNPERGVIRKRWHGRVTCALVFPEPYGVGMANLGLQTLYSLLNASENILAERFFSPKEKGPLGQAAQWLSEESRRPLRDFDLILFSLSFESSYIGVLKAIVDAGITLRSIERGCAEPVVLAGGVATFINPEPIAPFVDAFLLGEFEGIAPVFLDFLPRLLDRSEKRRDRLAAMAQSVPGTYVPGLYHPIFDSSGCFISWDREDDLPAPVPVVKAPEGLTDVPHTAILSPHAAFPEMFCVELVRGCGRGCRFCAAGFVYRPPRMWPMDAIRKTLKDAPDSCPIGLVGLEYMGRPGVEELCESLLGDGRRLAFSSLRVDELTPAFTRLLKRSGAKTATVAPEAGSEGLRRTLNKHLREEGILRGVETLAQAGIPNVKLYFMLGLPGEEDEDAEEIARLVGRIRETLAFRGKGRGRVSRVSVSVSIFVPKPWTPFQWAPFADVKVLKGRIVQLKRAIGRLPGITLSIESQRDALRQAVIARGDRRLAPVLEAVAVKEISFHRAVIENGLSSEMFIRKRDPLDAFPWEIVGHPVRRGYLLAEWNRALSGEETPFCDTTVCKRCGACGGHRTETGPWTKISQNSPR